MLAMSAMVTIHFHCVENSSLNILQNIFFCFPLIIFNTFYFPPLVFYLHFDLHISLCCVFNISLEHVCNDSLGLHSLSLYGKQQHEHFSKYLILCSMGNLKHSNFSKSLLWSKTHLVHSFIVNSILQTLMIQILHKV